MYEIGTVCLKIAGRDAGKRCVIVEEAKDGKALIEGDVRRRAVNIRHLEPTGKTVDVKKGADHAAVMKALGLAPNVSKPRKAAERPRQQRKAKADKPAKKPAKKAAKPKAEVGEKKEEKKEAPARKTPAKKKAPAKKA